MGDVKIDGNDVPAGEMLMKGSWNASLYGDLQGEWEAGQKLAKPDHWHDKCRLTAFLPWTKDGLEAFLHSKGITTLMIAGVNIDQW